MFFWITSTYLYLIMHFILKLQKSLYPAFKTSKGPGDVPNCGPVTDL